MSGGFAIGWRQVFAAMTIMGCTGMVAATYGVVAAPLASEFHPSRMMLMLAITVMSICSGIVSPIAGAMMDRLSLRRIMTVGVAGLVTGYLALSLVTSFAQVLIVFGLFLAASQALAGPVAGTVLLTRWFERRRGAALGVAISGIAAGSIVFPPLIQLLLDNFFWRDALRVLALILFVCTVPALCMIVDRPEDRQMQPDGVVTPLPSVPMDVQAILSNRQILGDPDFWMIFIVATTVLAGMMGMVTNVVPMAVGHGISPDKAALIVSVYAIAGFIAKLGFSAVADQINIRMLMSVVIGVFGAGMACLGEATSYAMILVGAAMVGMGGLIIPLQGLVIARTFGKAAIGRALGLLSVLQLCGLLAMPPTFGLIYDRTASYSIVFLTFGGLSLVAMLLVLRIRLYSAS